MEKTGHNKKVLIIAYYWPPAGGPGVQRVLKFAKYLPEFGWEPIILTVEDGEYPAMDTSLLDDIPDGIRVYKTKAFEPYRLYKFFSGQKKDAKIDNYILKNKKQGFLARLSKWIRFNIFIPDARVGWLPYAINQGFRIIKEENISVIFSSSPPHSLQLSAMRLAMKSKIPWVADFRDPWSSIVFYQDEDRLTFTKKLDGFLEQKVLTRANRVITISGEIKNDLDKIGRRNDTIVICNGYDAADFTPIINTRKGNLVKITYAGFLSDTRLPKIFLELLADNPKDIPGKIELHLYGHSSPGFDRRVEELGLEAIVIKHGYVDHTTLTENLCQSDALLMVVDNVPDNKGILTGKLFDYMGARRPIIAIGPEGGEAGKIIRESSSGWYITYDDAAGMKACLHELISGQHNFQFKTEPFERKNLTGQLAQVLDSVTASHSSTPEK